jgi:YggT family protein
MSPLAATARADVASYISTVIYVYLLLIFAYIVTQWLFAAGLRPPYSRTFDAVLGFLRDIVEPYLRIFRRFVPPLGPIDLSPILAVIVLVLFNQLVVQGLIHG